MNKEAIVVHSGGMDSSLCLAMAIETHGKDSVLSVSFSYGQRHSVELLAAEKICAEWGVEHLVLDINCLSQITQSALLGNETDIIDEEGNVPNTLVEGRNGLMVRIASIHAVSLAAKIVYVGVIEVESANSGYRDCTRHYMDLMQVILRLDFGIPDFEIKTPVIHMTKCETMSFGYEMGVLPFLLENTITCYNGVTKQGCMECPACKLRNEGISQFLGIRPEVEFSYRDRV